MTYHDTNRAAKFRSTRLGAAVEQITGKRTELSIGGGGNVKIKQKRTKVAVNIKPKISPKKVRISDKEIVTVKASETVIAAGDNGLKEADVVSEVDVLTSSTTVKQGKVAKAKPISKAAARKLELDKQEKIQRDEIERGMDEEKERGREQDENRLSSMVKNNTQIQISDIKSLSSTTSSTSSLLQQSILDHQDSQYVQSQRTNIYVHNYQEDDISVDDDSDGDIFDDNYKKRKKMKKNAKKSRT